MNIAEILVKHKLDIIDNAIKWQKIKFPYRTNNYSKCERDINFVLDAYIADLSNDTISNVINVGSRYWIGPKRQIQNHESELAVHNFIVEYISSNLLKTDEMIRQLSFLKDILLKIISSEPATGIENLFSKRRQVRAAWDQERIPSKELIHDLLYRSLNIAPSKQNLYPFKIHVIGPDNEQDHKNIAGICALWRTGSVNNWSEDVLQHKGQDYKKAPWVLVFTLRKCEPNNFVKEHSANHGDTEYIRFNQVHHKFYRNDVNKKIAAFESGMFIEILTGLCLENDLSISYIESWPTWRWNEVTEQYKIEKNKVGFQWDTLPWVTEVPLMVVQIGYKANMHDPLSTNAIYPDRISWENKPSVNDIVKYHLNQGTVK